MISKILSIFSFLNWIFGILHDWKIRKEISVAQELDLQKGKNLKLRVEAENAALTDQQINKRLEKSGGYRDDKDL